MVLIGGWRGERPGTLSPAELVLTFLGRGSGVEARAQHNPHLPPSIYLSKKARKGVSAGGSKKNLFVEQIFFPLNRHDPGLSSYGHEQ